MESLVVCLLQQVVDPPLISLHYAKALEMPGHAPHHSGHSGHCLQDEAPLHPLGHRHVLFSVGSQEVVASSDGSDAVVGNPFLYPFRLNVLHFYFLGRPFWVDIVRHPMVRIVVNSFSSWQKIVQRF